MCDICLTPFAITYTRFKIFGDFLLPFVYTPFSLLISVPRFAVGGDISSVWKPFEMSVSDFKMHLLVYIFISLKLIKKLKFNFPIKGMDCVGVVYCCNNGVEHNPLVV